MATVLVIDDDPLFREIARDMLEAAGHAVRLADDGSAVDRIEADPAPDLAVVDMLMPERDGIETIPDLRRRWPGVKLIAVSAGARGLTSDLLLRAARAMGADASLEKPIDRGALLQLVDSLLG